MRVKLTICLAVLGALALPGAASAEPGFLGSFELLGPTPNNEAVGPRVAMTPGGETVFAWSRKVSGSWVTQMRVRTLDGTLSGPIDLSTPAPDLAAGARVATDAQGRAVFAWGRRDGQDRVIQMRVRQSDGTLTPVQDVGTGASGVQLAVNPQGNAVAAWEVVPSGGIAVRGRSADGTLSSTFYFPAASNPQVATDSAGRAAIVYTEGSPAIAWIRVREADGMVSAPQQLSTAGLASNLRVKMDAAGNALAVWNRGGQVELRRLGADSSTLGPVESIGTGSFPALDVDANGRAIVAWSDSATGAIKARERAADGTLGPERTLGVLVQTQAVEVAIDAAGRALFIWSGHTSDLGVHARYWEADGSEGPISTLSPVGFSIAVALDGEGNGVAAWDQGDATAKSFRAAAFDRVAPRLDSLSIPARVERGVLASVSVSPFDVWTPGPLVRWDFGDGTAAEGRAVSHRFMRAGRPTVGVSATDSRGNASTLSRTIEVVDTRRPMLTGVRVVPPVFRVPKGTSFRFRLSEPATFRATILRRAPGRRVRGRCRKPTSKTRSRRRCRRLVAAASLRATGLSAGNKRLRWSGRARGKKLKPGRYSARLQAVDPSGNRSKTATRILRIRPKR